MPQMPRTKTSEFEKRCKALRIRIDDTEAQRNSPELSVWVRKHKNRHFVPLPLLGALRQKTEFDGEPTAYSIVDGAVIPENQPQEVE
jgi:hypothetical protein